MTTSSPAESGKAPLLSALRYRDFRLYWAGYVVSVSGQQMLWVVQGWLIYELTGSKLLLGALGLTQVGPAMVLTLFGGVLADKVDQRRLLMVNQLLRMSLMWVLAGLSFAQVVEVWHVLLIVFLSSAVGAFENPARQALFPHLIQRHALTSAVALNASIHPGTRIVGPTAAGFLLALIVDATSSPMVAAGAIFSITAIGFGVYALFLQVVYVPPVRRSTGGNFMKEIGEGLRFIWQRPTFSFLIGMTYFTQFFAVSMTILFPVYAKDILVVGPGGLGLLYTALGAGNLAGTILVGSVGNVWHRGWIIVAGSAVLGAFVFLFTLSSWFPLSLVLLGLAGIGASAFNVAAQSALQLMVPDELRGRVMGVYGLTHTGIRPLGETQLGVMAALVSAPFALGLGGILVLAFAFLIAAPNRRIRGLSAASVTVDAVASSAEGGASRSP